MKNNLSSAVEALKQKKKNNLNSAVKAFKQKNSSPFKITREGDLTITQAQIKILNHQKMMRDYSAIFSPSRELDSTQALTTEMLNLSIEQMKKIEDGKIITRMLSDEKNGRTLKKMSGTQQ